MTYYSCFECHLTYISLSHTHTIQFIEIKWKTCFFAWSTGNCHVMSFLHKHYTNTQTDILYHSNIEFQNLSLLCSKPIIVSILWSTMCRMSLSFIAVNDVSAVFIFTEVNNVRAVFIIFMARSFVIVWAPLAEYHQFTHEAENQITQQPQLRLGHDFAIVVVVSYSAATVARTVELVCAVFPLLKQTKNKNQKKTRKVSACWKATSPTPLAN